MTQEDSQKSAAPEHPGAALLETIERLNLTSQAISGIMYDWDIRTGRVTRTEGLLSLLGYSPDEIEGEVDWWDKHIHPDDLDRVREAFATAERHCEIEYRVRKKNGSYIYVWDRALVIRDKAGKAVRIVGSNLDITKRKELEDALRQSWKAEQRARENAERIAGTLKSLQTITAALSAALTVEQLSAIVMGQVLPAVGSDACILYSAQQQPGKLEAVAVAGYDEKVMEEFAQIELNSNHLFADAVRLKRANFIETSKGRSRYPELSKLKSRPGDQGLAILPFNAPDRDTALGLLCLSFEEVKTFSNDEYSFLIIVAEQCAQVLQRARLYEAERAARTREREARERAEAANRAKDEFLAAVSHELRSPLQSILGWIKMVRSAKLDPETSAKAYETIERNTKAQIQLITDLLEVSRYVTGKVTLKMAPVRLPPILEGAIDSLRPAALNKEIDLVSDFENLPPIFGDGERLQQVLWNLLNNAVKFTPRGGTISVSSRTQNNSVIITVKDTGAGISPEFLPFVFDRFRQADSSDTKGHGGLGLGLAIVRHIVELHGGQVKAESEGANSGSTFTVTLPLRAEAHREPNKEIVEAKNDSADLQGRRVLVVDDEADTRELLSAVLRTEGADVLAVGNAEDATIGFDLFAPEVVLSDIGMPNQNGYTLMRNLRKRSPIAFKAAALTAFARESDKNMAMEAGYDLHVSKPIEPGELVQVVRRLLEQQSVASI